MSGTTAPAEWACRLCGARVQRVLDLGRQPVSQAFRRPGAEDPERFFDLVVGFCEGCAMVQQLHEVPRTVMFHAGYPFRSASSVRMRDHFAGVADHLLATELTGPDPFAVEIGSNDGTLLRSLAGAGVRHLGVDPSAEAAGRARDAGVRVLVDFFDEGSARRILERHGSADVVFSANTVSHIAYLDSVMRGVATLLAPHGVLVLEDRYLGDIVGNVSFDQIYDEHFYLFSAASVHALARRHGFELVGVDRLPVHGGSMRYTIARAGARQVGAAVPAALVGEQRQGVTTEASFARFAAGLDEVATGLTELLRRLRSQGARVVGYGATAKSATLTNYCGIGPDLLDYVCDSTPEKQGLLTPGVHIPVRSLEHFRADRPDYAVLLAWNHRAEVLEGERAFTDGGGRWIHYVPRVHVEGGLHPSAAVA